MNFLGDSFEDKPAAFFDDLVIPSHGHLFPYKHPG